MSITKIRVVAVLLLVGSILNILITFQAPPVEASKTRLTQHQAQQVREAGGSTEPRHTLAQSEEYRIAYTIGTILAGGLLVLGTAMCAQLLLRGTRPMAFRGTEPWVLDGIKIYFAASVFGCMLAIPMLLTLFEQTTVSSAFIVLLLLAVTGRVAVVWWCYTVVHDHHWESMTGVAPEQKLAERLPSYMRDHRAPPAPSRVTPIEVPTMPEALLYMQGALDDTGFGGWLQTRGECDITLSPPPSAGTQVLAADESGNWYPLGTPDPQTGRLALQLPAGMWYLLVRSQSGDGTPTIGTVTPGAAKPTPSVIRHHHRAA
jgi:hypothetical protein